MSSGPVGSGPKYILADEKISLFRFLDDRYPKLAVVEYDRCHEVIHIFVLGKTYRSPRQKRTTSISLQDTEPNGLPDYRTGMCFSLLVECNGF
jgi:hypothetical protein